MSRVERLLQAFILIDTTPRKPSDPKVVRLQDAMDQVRAQLTAEEAARYGREVSAYWRERRERAWSRKWQ
jgi:hypothetical protein